MKTSLILLLLLIPFNVISQCQQYIFSTVPATEWSTWTYVNCETLDTNTFSIPCCQYTLPRCAIIGSPTLIEGDGFHALMVNPVGEPWEDCEQYNEETCVGDVDGDGIVTVSDLLLYLSDPYVGTGDLEGIIQNFGNQCD
ncbi:hypothetical protein N9145_00910 [bacterium]|jgi:hypothetical protein|nr:hypothetical protein [bacterium]|tara:strand:- start:53 stop:472 length:420 start_codon:yes stop_codon:yes gene_type:complete